MIHEPPRNNTWDGGTVGSMECNNCEQIQRRFYCINCLRERLQLHDQGIKAIADARDKYVALAIQALGPLNEKRQRRATIADLDRDLQSHRIQEQRAQMGIASAKEEIRKRRTILLERREALAHLYAQFPYLVTNASSTSTLAPSLAITKDPSIPKNKPQKLQHPNKTSSRENPIETIATEIAILKQQHAQLSREIMDARQTLVQELVDVFHVVEVGGRPAMNIGNGVDTNGVDRFGSRGKRGEWEIAGRLMCVPGDIKRYPPLQINAAITHTLHFLHLLSYYLGVNLPFEVTWTTLPDGGPAQADENALSLTFSLSEKQSSPPTSPLSGSRFRYGNDGNITVGFSKRGVGTPWISSGRGNSGGWSKWATKNPLHLPTVQNSSNSALSSRDPPSRVPPSPDRRASTPAPPSTSSNSNSNPSTPLHSPVPTRARTVLNTASSPLLPPQRIASAPTTPITPTSSSALSKFGLGLGLLKPYLGISGGSHDQPPLAQDSRRRTVSTSSMGRSQTESIAEGKKSGLKGSSTPSFTTGLAMLLYNVAYLAHSQGVEIPLAHTGEILRNLWAVCCSPELGRRSHETYPLLPHPTPNSSPLDFAQLLQATTTEPVLRSKARRISSDVFGSIGTSTDSDGRVRPHLVRHKRIGREGVIVEEDEWDLLEDTP